MAFAERGAHPGFADTTERSPTPKEHSRVAAIIPKRECASACFRYRPARPTAEHAPWRLAKEAMRMDPQLRDLVRDAPARPGRPPAGRPNGHRCARGLAALLVLLTLAAAGPAARALDLAETPSPTAFSVLGNGDVSAIVPQRQRHLHRRQLRRAGGRSPAAFARLDAASGRRIALLAEAQGGEVRASVPDGSGGFYIGGTFTHARRRDARGIGHILADGSVDPDFNPGLHGNERARQRARLVRRRPHALRRRQLHLHRRPAAQQPRGGRHRDRRCDALQSRPGSAPTARSTRSRWRGRRSTSAASSSLLGGQTRNGLAKVAGDTGGDLGWVPNPTYGQGRGAVYAIEAAGDFVYVGGFFTGIGGQRASTSPSSRPRAGRRSRSSRQIPRGNVYALLLAGPVLYAGGNFDIIGGQLRPAAGAARRRDRPRHLLQRRRSRSTASARWPSPARALSSAASCPAPASRSRSSETLVKVDAMTGAGIQAFSPGIGDFGVRPTVKTLAVAGTSIYAGGDISFVNRVTRHGVAALDADGVPTAFNPDAGPPASSATTSTRSPSGTTTSTSAATSPRWAASRAT